MANKKTARQRIKTNERDRQRNVAVKSRMRTAVKDAESAIASKDEAAIKTTFVAAISEIDRAASKGIIHRKTAGRKKAALEHQRASASS